MEVCAFCHLCLRICRQKVIYKIGIFIPGAELSLITESFALLNDLLLPFLLILDASCPISDLHLANVLFDVILPSVLGSSL